MDWVQPSILLGFLLAGIVFLFVPKRKTAHHKTQLNTRSITFDQVEYLVLLISKSRTKSAPLEELLQYKIVQLLARGANRKCRKLVIITGGPEDGAGSAVKNARDIRTSTYSLSHNEIDIDIKDVLKINDPHETFEKVQSALRDIESDTHAHGKVLCDFTGGNKMMSLGMALASIGRAKLVYCIDNPENQEPSHYIEINAAEVFREVSEDIEST